MVLGQSRSLPGFSSSPPHAFPSSKTERATENDLAATGKQRFTDRLPEPEPASSFIVLSLSQHNRLLYPCTLFYQCSIAIDGKGNVAITLLFPLWIKYFLLLVVNLLFQCFTRYPLVLQGNHLWGAISTAFMAAQKSAPHHQSSSKVENTSPFKTPSKLLPIPYFLSTLFTFTVLHTILEGPKTSLHL